MQLAFHPAVEADVATIRDWYVAQDPKLSDPLAADFDAALERIRRHPRMYVRIVDFHRLQLARFPCHIYYAVRGDIVYVVGASHSHANPSAVLANIASRIS